MNIFDTLTDKVENKINSWKPEEYDNDLNYKKSLYIFLKEMFDNENIEERYPIGRHFADIVIDNNILVIVKKSIKELSKFYCTSGEFRYYIENWENDIILVVCEGITPDFYDNLKKYADDWSLRDIRIVDLKIDREND